MTFLPDNYKSPEGNYMKLLEGENTFRVLSSAIVGYEYWNTDNKPVRSKKEFVSTPKDIRLEDGKPTPIKHFWAFLVYNYRAEKQQILEITQVSIQASIKALVQNPKWGDPKGYDITVTRSGSGYDTEYTTMPNPHSQLEVEPINVNLNALYEGADPFVEVSVKSIAKELGGEIVKEINVEDIPY